MDWSRIVYLSCEELQDSARRASRAFSRIEEMIDRAGHYSIEIHDEIQTLLDCAARLRSFLFPKNWDQEFIGSDIDISKTRSKKLRTVLEVSEFSLLADQALRNHEAHFDERLTRWFKTSKNKTYGRRMLGSLENLGTIGISREDVMSMLDPITGAYFFWDDEINIFELGEEIRTLRSRIRSYLTSNRYPGMTWDELHG